jgi:hypothetical protein
MSIEYLLATQIDTEEKKTVVPGENFGKLLLPILGGKA